MAPIILIFSLGLISNSKFMARLSDWMGAMAGWIVPPGSATVYDKKAQLSLTNPRDACEKFARFT